MVTVAVRETYDLHTVRNKITLIGIHTPKKSIIARAWGGLITQYKYYKPLYANVVLASAQRLPADIKSVGTTADQISPEDMFNPILYRACTNDSMNLLEGRLAYMMNSSTGAEINGNTAKSDNDSVTPFDDDFDTYYGLLSNTKGWKTAHPQRGLVMSRLVPLVYEQLYSYGVNQNGVGGISPMPGTTGVSQAIGIFNDGRIRGRPRRLPAVNTSYFNGNPQTGTNGAMPTGFRPDDAPTLAQATPETLNTMVGCIVMPPSRLSELYYRMTVTWYVSFTGLRSLNDLEGWNGIAQDGQNTHFVDYSYSASKDGESSRMVNDMNLVSTDADIQKVM